MVQISEVFALRPEFCLQHSHKHAGHRSMTRLASSDLHKQAVMYTHTPHIYMLYTHSHACAHSTHTTHNTHTHTALTIKSITCAQSKAVEGKHS